MLRRVYALLKELDSIVPKIMVEEQSIFPLLLIGNGLRIPSAPFRWKEFAIF